MNGAWQRRPGAPAPAAIPSRETGRDINGPAHRTHHGTEPAGAGGRCHRAGPFAQIGNASATRLVSAEDDFCQRRKKSIPVSCEVLPRPRTVMFFGAQLAR